MKEILVIGPEGSGKTLLLRRIREFTENPTDHLSSEETIPTVGVDISTVILPCGPVSVREIGSTMFSRCDSYLPDCYALIFVVDVSDMGSIATSMVLLNEILINYDDLLDKEILIALNKTDLCDVFSLATFENIFRLEELLERFPLMSSVCGSSLDLTLPLHIISFIERTTIILQQDNASK